MQSLAGSSSPAAASIVAFLGEIPVAQVKANIVPRLSTTAWGRQALAALANRTGISPQVQRAIAATSKGAA
jgi:hypothetical protein